ncbi:MAG: BlaI/MecI/CopY family transcriptional regulator [Saprospiraceae bacterium]|nr:BlaI/MecI/CopY family transcriptional regulator [Saprospiraceae bacterium]
MEKRLTKAEEDIMQILWRLERGTVSDILDVIEKESEDGKRPPHSSISTIVRILEDKGFVSHKAYGKTHEYYPIILKVDYGKRSLSKLVSDYFDGSAHSLVSFLVKEEKMDADELKSLLDILDGKK